MNSGCLGVTVVSTKRREVSATVPPPGASGSGTSVFLLTKARVPVLRGRSAMKGAAIVSRPEPGHVPHVDEAVARSAE